MSPEDERHQQLRRRATEPDRGHHDHGQQRGDRPVEADQRGEHRRHQHGEGEQSRAAFADPGDQHLPRPRGHARGLQPGADHEQRDDEDHRGVAEAGERLAEIEDARGVERERGPHGHDHDGEAVPHEQHHDRADDREDDADVAQGIRLLAASGR
jgi:hypothetical protein